jgi:hypothetical protein
MKIGVAITTVSIAKATNTARKGHPIVQNSETMTDRKNLKISPETYDLLREKKGQYQTWDGFFHEQFGDE